MNMIEIFPEKSGCPAGCSLCSLGNNSTKQKSKIEVDKNIILTFKLIESIFRENEMNYCMTYAGRTENLFNNLSVIMSYPKYLTGLRLCMEHKVNLKKYNEHLSLIKSEYTKLSDSFKKLELSVFGLIFTPQNPYKLNINERKFIYKYFDFLSKDIFKDTNHIYFGIEAHSNMVNPKEWWENNHVLNKRDNQFMNKIENEIPDPDSVKKVIRDTIQEIGDDHLFYNSRLFVKNNDDVTFVYMNRIISPLDRGEWSVSEFNLNQAARLIEEANDDVVISLTPQGVMLQHSSVRINNPVIWFSHEDFRNAVKILTRKGKSILEIQKILLEQNYNLMVLNPKIINYKKSMGIFVKLRYSTFEEVYD